MELILCGFISPRNWGFLADRYLPLAVVLGALAMTFHASMAVETPCFYILELVSYYWEWFV
jgi:hypothetical protein